MVDREGRGTRRRSWLGLAGEFALGHVEDEEMLDKVGWRLDELDGSLWYNTRIDEGTEGS